VQRNLQGTAVGPVKNIERRARPRGKAKAPSEVLPEQSELEFMGKKRENCFHQRSALGSVREGYQDSSAFSNYTLPSAVARLLSSN
jgi:hypothetical protein